MKFLNILLTSLVVLGATAKRCGPDYGSCSGKNACCSKDGYCGKSSSYCGTGCQSEFGSCGTIITTTKTKTKKPTATPTPAEFKFHMECQNPNEWALTIDDGPYIYDYDILDLLKKENVKATFFLIGNSIDLDSGVVKSIIKRMHKEGHVIGNHSFNHVDLSVLSKDELRSELEPVEDFVEKYIGKRPALVRPPFGSGWGNSTFGETLQDLGYNGAIVWAVDTMDWSNKGEDVEYVLKQFENNLGKGMIALNHSHYGGSSKQSVVNLLKKEIDYMKSKGYKSVTVDKCIGLPAYQKN